MRYFGILFILFTGNLCFSQNSVKGIIVGNIIDTTTGKGISAVTIRLNLLGDTAKAQSFISDHNGGFEIHGLNFGNYQITFSAIGYSKIRLDSIHIRTERYDFNLGDIKMFPQSTQMETVVVYYEKPLIENRDGAIIYNIGESALSASSSLSEILKTMPLISNNTEGKILLKGKEPRILIDGKPTNLNAQQLNDLLEAMPGGLIEKIEMMSNPPQQFATDEGGVINIVTKKGKVGTTGRITAYAGTLGDANIATNISYRDKKWILQLTGGIGYTVFNGTNTSTRETFYPADTSNFLVTETSSKNKSYRPNLRATADYELNKNNLFNITALLNFTGVDNFSETYYKNLNRFKEVYRNSSRSNNTQGVSPSPSVSGSYIWKKKKQTRENLNLFSSVTFGNYENERNYIESFRFPNGNPTGKDSTLKQLTRNNNIAWLLRANYDKPFSKNILLTTGINIEDNNFNNTLLTSVLQNETELFTQIDSLSPRFTFSQTIVSARLGITTDLPKLWRIIIGSSAENTGFGFKFKLGGNNYANDYWNFLPNMTIRKNWRSSGYSTSLVYRKTIRRPTVAELNPSVDYSNRYALRFGNISLTPQLAHNIDYNVGVFKTKYNINLSLGYNYVKDIIQLIRTLTPGEKTQITYNNITDRQEYEATLWAGYTVSKKLRLNFGSGYAYNQYSTYDKAINKYKNGATLYTNVNGNYIFSDLINFDVNVRYNSIANPQGQSRSTIKQMFGVQTKWFNKRLTVGLVAIDPFMQERYTTKTSGKNFNIINAYDNKTRNFRLTLGYNLNKTQTTATANKQQVIKAAVNKVSSQKTMPAQTKNPGTSPGQKK